MTTTKTDPWTIEEVHGILWAWEGPTRPRDDEFFSHNRPHRPRILGPFHHRDVAEARVEAARKAR